MNEVTELTVLDYKCLCPSCGAEEHVAYVEVPKIKTRNSTNAAKLKRKAKKRKNVRARRKK